MRKYLIKRLPNLGADHTTCVIKCILPLKVLKAKEEGRLVEMFGTGTAAIVSPVGNILYHDKMQSIPHSDDEKAVSRRYVVYDA